MAIVRLEPSSRAYLGELGEAPADRVVLPSLVHLDGHQVVSRPHHLGDELVERVLGARQWGNGDAERRDHRGDVRRGEWIRRLHDRLPQLEPVVVAALEPLDVHQSVANLDGGVAREREQVDLVAFVDAAGGEFREAGVRLPEALAERPPLPARHDRRRGHQSSSPTIEPRYRARSRPAPEVSGPTPDLRGSARRGTRYRESGASIGSVHADRWSGCRATTGACCVATCWRASR